MASAERLNAVFQIYVAIQTLSIDRENSSLLFKGKGKTILVIGCGSLYDCHMLRISHFLDNGLKESVETVSHTT
jgi:hypothetical protein